MLGALSETVRHDSQDHSHSSLGTVSSGDGDITAAMIVSWRGALRVPQEGLRGRSRGRQGHAQTEMLWK